MWRVIFGTRLLHSNVLELGQRYLIQFNGRANYRKEGRCDGRMAEIDQETIDGLYKEIMPQDHDIRVDNAEAAVKKLIGNSSPELEDALGVYRISVERHGFKMGLLFGVHTAIDTIRLYHSKVEGTVN